MKNILTLTLISCLSVFAHAATNITSATVSGTWTLAGSPYKVFNDITINVGTTLSIQPGVEVVFQGYYNMAVKGSLQAVGTSASPISFHVSDTTGWSTSASVGGWYGITIGDFASTVADSTKFAYCNLADIKNWIYIYKKDVHMYNCNFLHNRGNIFAALATTSCVFEMNNCSIHDNYAYDAAVVVNGGVQNIHDNVIYNNSGASALLIGGGIATVFERNDVHDNSTSQGTVECGDKVVFRKNRVYNNVNYNSPAVFCHGTADIDGNRICNNYHTYGFCGAMDGGGGIQVSSNTSVIDPASISYIIRNNVIANNYSAFEGGGIRVYDSKTTIVNNQIVNNTAPSGGAIRILTDSAQVVIKNNIITGNVSTASSGDPSAISGLSFYSAKFTFDHNYTQHNSAKVLAQQTGFIKLGDTTTNIVGTTPGYIDPSITASYTESALTRNFGLLPGSICIDKGDTAGCYVADIDLAGNPRIYGTAIDLGAYEYRPAVVTAAPTVFKTQSLQVYPNPAANILFISVADTKGSIVIVDILGKQVLQATVDNKTTSFDISLLSRGIYFAVWQHDGTHDIQKVIVE